MSNEMIDTDKSKVMEFSLIKPDGQKDEADGQYIDFHIYYSGDVASQTPDKIVLTTGAEKYTQAFKDGVPQTITSQNGEPLDSLPDWKQGLVGRWFGRALQQ